jgi:hypothetical protein
VFPRNTRPGNSPDKSLAISSFNFCNSFPINLAQEHTPSAAFSY